MKGTESEKKFLNFVQTLTSLDEQEKDFANATTRQSEIDLQKTDIDHFIEELDYYLGDEKLTPNQCFELVYWMHDILKTRRGYKWEQCLYNTLDAHRAKIAYSNQRQALIGELHKKEKELHTLYKPRILSYEVIHDTITKGVKGRKPKNPFKTIEE